MVGHPDMFVASRPVRRIKLIRRNEADQRTGGLLTEYGHGCLVACGLLLITIAACIQKMLSIFTKKMKANNIKKCTGLSVTNRNNRNQQTTPATSNQCQRRYANPRRSHREIQGAAQETPSSARILDFHCARRTAHAFERAKCSMVRDIQPPCVGPSEHSVGPCHRASHGTCIPNAV